MFNFVITAPGRISLFGEPIIFHEKMLSASIDLRTTLIFAELPQSKEMIKIEFPQINLSLDLPTQIFKCYFHNCYTYLNDIYLLHTNVQDFIIRQKLCRTRHQRVYLQALFFLLIYIGHKECIEIRSFHMYLSTDLRISEDLGSEESAAVCLAACYFHWARLQKYMPSKKFDVQDLNMISKYALKCEKYIHGSVSIVNVILCTHGSIIMHEMRTFDKLPHVPNLRIMLIDTKKKQNLISQKSKAKELNYSHPEIFHSIRNIFDTISMMTAEILVRCTKLYTYEIYEAKHADTLMREQQKFQYLIHVSQELLNMLNISYQKLNTICSIARKYGLAGKYSDLSASRYAYIWLFPHTTDRVIIPLLQELTANGFIVKIVNLSCNGVQIE